MMTGKHKQDEKKRLTPDPEKETVDTPVTETDAGIDFAEAATKDDGAEKLAQKEAELAELNDKYLRLYSEFDNFRKRTIREKTELSKTASADVIALLLPVIDDLERAIKAHSAAGEAAAPLTDGVNLIYNKLLSLLGQQGLEPINSLGEEFDTDFHEAITNIPAESPEMKGKVVDEVQRGYMLNGKVIRFAKVVVGS
jgi:molecular chaperone GrpE